VTLTHFNGGGANRERRRAHFNMEIGFEERVGNEPADGGF
jgi:hypothetical protein